MRRAPAVERFWEKVNKTETCWLWMGHYRVRDYGRIKIGAQGVLAHRYSWTIANGEIPDGMAVLHKCDNPPCVNPDHLYLGTQAENARDRESRGRRTPRCGETHPAAKLTPDIVLGIVRSDESGPALAIRHGVTRSTISSIRRGRSWNHVTGLSRPAGLRKWVA